MIINFCFPKSLPGAPLDKAFLTRLKDISGAKSFVETGTYLGDTVDAVRGMFDRVVSIELSKELMARAKQRFAQHPNVTILNGDSASMLEKGLGSLGAEPALIWLDAHFSGIGTSKGHCGNTPILDELEVIERSGRTSDVILIDDARMFAPVAEGFLTHDAVGGYPDLRVVYTHLEKIGNGYDCLLLADILVCIPRCFISKYSVSGVLRSVSQLRLEPICMERKDELEKNIANADGEERLCILSLPDLFAEQLKYGLGGDFCYWRYLVNQQSGNSEAASDDFALWKKCSIAPKSPDYPS